MTKISTGLRSFICLLPADAPDHGDGDGDAGEQAGTSYTSSEAHSFASYVESSRRGVRGREKVNCSSGGAQMLACFRAGAINLVSWVFLSVLLRLGSGISSFLVEFMVFGFWSFFFWLRSWVRETVVV